MKKIVSKYLTTLHFSGTIDEVIGELKAEEKYYSQEYTNLRVDCEYSYETTGASYYRYNLIADRLETDEEEAIRIKQEEEATIIREEYQRKQYEELKAKFENK